MINLNIGSGERSKNPEWLGVDPYTDADIQAFMWDLPFKDNSIDHIYCSNALEHISKFQVVPTLLEWKRVLKPGGKIKIVVPDLEWACRYWVEHQNVNWAMDILYGHQRHEGEYHRTGYSPDILKVYLEAAGGFGIYSLDFIGGTEDTTPTDDPEIVKTKVEQRQIRLEAYKLPADSNTLYTHIEEKDAANSF